MKKILTLTSACLLLSVLTAQATTALCSGWALLQGQAWNYVDAGWTLQTYDTYGRWQYNALNPNPPHHFVISSGMPYLQYGYQGRMVATKGLQVRYADFTVQNTEGYVDSIDFQEYPQIPLGIYYFAGWKDDPRNNRIYPPSSFISIDSYMWQDTLRVLNVDSFSYRQPLTDWFDDKQAVTDQEINWAATAGIDFFSFLWYYPPFCANTPPGQQLFEGLNQPLYNYLKSQPRPVKFSICYTNHDPFEIGKLTDWQTEWDRWTDTFALYMKRPDYVRVKIRDDEPAKPLFIIWTPETFHQAWTLPGRPGPASAINILRQKAAAACTVGVYIVGLRSQTSDTLAWVLKPVNEGGEGYDIISDYNLNWAGYKGQKLGYYMDFVDGHKPIWNDRATMNQPVAPEITSGWDRRAWRQYSDDVFYPDGTPEKFKILCDSGKSWICNRVYNYDPLWRPDALGYYIPFTVVYAWNENGEGGYVTPCVGDGFGYLDKLHDVFVNSQPLSHPSNDYYVVQDPIINQSKNANYSITAAGWTRPTWNQYNPTTCNVSGDVTFQAGYVIDLKPGFSVPQGNNFHAYVPPPPPGGTWSNMPSNGGENTGGGKPNAGDSVSENLPKVYALGQNCPNPFNQGAKIDYALPKPSKVSLKIYSVTGQVVRTLIDEKQRPGYYAARWDGKNDFGKRVASGIYLYRMEAGDFTKTNKMIVVR